MTQLFIGGTRFCQEVHTLPEMTASGTISTHQSEQPIRSERQKAQAARPLVEEGRVKKGNAVGPLIRLMERDYQGDGGQECKARIVHTASIQNVAPS
ncbi:hypothetical protein ACOMHN_018436 [Nucella lapillus]